MLLQALMENLQSRRGGRYDDLLVREGGHWKFKRRLASNDIPLPNAAGK
jgi:hypothetical protein